MLTAASCPIDEVQEHFIGFAANYKLETVNRQINDIRDA